LSVKALEGCTESFTIKADDQRVGGGDTGEKIWVAVGTYDIIFNSVLRHKVIREDVVIRESEETIVDFTQELGALLVAGYPELARTLKYSVYQDDSKLNYSSLSVDRPYCVLPGTYTIDFWLLAQEEDAFEVEIRMGERTVVEPDTWPKQVGYMSFADGGTSFRIFDRQTGEPVGYLGGYAAQGGWMVAGVYNIVLTKPYPGFPYENVEIIPGEEIVLDLPEAPSP